MNFALILVSVCAEHMEPDENSPSLPLPEWVLLEYRQMLHVTGVFDDPLPKSVQGPAARARQQHNSAGGVEVIQRDLPESRVAFSHLSPQACESLTDAITASAPLSAGSKADSHRPIIRHLRTLSGTDPSLLARPERVTCSVLSVLDLMSSTRTNIKDVCLLDPKASQRLAVADGPKFKWFLFGGILGDDPPRDRTSELRTYGFPSRHLGEVQMTTDTAVAVVKRVVEDGIEMADLEWIDRPELTYGKRESVEMPFRYLKLPDGAPLMPEGMKELIGKDMDRAFEF